MKLHHFYNRAAGFVSALRLTCDELPREFRVSGSHQNQPQDWEEIPFQEAKQEAGLFLNFDKPVNYASLRLEIFGNPVPFSQISLGSIISRTRTQIRSLLQGKSVAFMCCARDCKDHLPHSLNELLKVARLFNRYKFFVFENDSRDGSAELLRDISAALPMERLTARNLDTTFSSRTARLSYCRNQLAQAAIKESFDFFVVADLDGVISYIEPDEFLSCFEHDAWDACFPGARDKYYDLWALRHPSIMPFDYNKALNKQPYVVGEDNAQLLNAIPARNLEFHKFHQWLEVDSAFGGVGIYRKEAFKMGRYYGAEGSEEICEHVPFHRALRRKGARLYINPRFMI